MPGRRAALGLGLAAGAASRAMAQGRPTLREAARARGLVFGTAVQSQALVADAGLRSLAQREAELWVPAWEAKWGPLQPEEGRFEFTPLRALLQLAQPSGQRLRGHCLVWHEANPPWLEPALAEGPARARRVLEEHFRVVLTTTAPAMRDWDVVNESIANPPGSDNPSASSGDLRDTPWLRALGPSYVELALRTARQMDRTLRLTLNDYGVEADTPWAAEKRARLLRQVRGLLDRGTPLDAIGIQGHLQMREPFRPEPFVAFCQELRGMGLAVLVTELDIREPDVLAPNVPARDQAVADYVGRFVEAALAGGVRTVLTWGLADRESWLVSTPSVARADGATTRGLPFDDALRPKPFRDALLDAFARV